MGVGNGVTGEKDSDHVVDPTELLRSLLAISPEDAESVRNEADTKADRPDATKK
jgi:hypothetical protein